MLRSHGPPLILTLSRVHLQTFILQFCLHSHPSLLLPVFGAGYRSDGDGKGGNSFTLFVSSMLHVVRVTVVTSLTAFFTVRYTIGYHRRIQEAKKLLGFLALFPVSFICCHIVFFLFLFFVCCFAHTLMKLDEHVSGIKQGYGE